MSDIERQREHFESISDLYFESRQSKTHLLLKHLMWKGFFGRHPELNVPGMRMLEPMCGYAEGKRIIETYVTGDINYTGFDYSQPLVDRVREADPSINITHGDVLSYGLKEGEDPFDLMVIIGGLHHVFARAADALERLSVTLKPGGHFINFEPTHNCFITRRVRERIYAKNAVFDEQTEEGFELVDYNRLFDEAGYDKVDQCYPGLLSYVLFYNPDAFPWLNVGGNLIVRGSYLVDQLFVRGPIGRTLSFATLTLWRKR